jgi:AraC-like DNA-binding protein
MLLFAEIGLDATRFAAMTPELRTEAVLLAMERGKSVAEIARVIGSTASEIRQIAAATYLFQLSTDRTMPADDVGEERPKHTGGRPSGTGTAFKILDLLTEAGTNGLAANSETLAKTLSVSERQVQRAMNRLLGEDFIVRLKAPSGKSPAVWTITDDGRAVRNEVAARQGR